MDCLQTAVSLAFQSRIIHLFVDKGPKIPTFLSQLTDTHPQYNQTLLSAYRLNTLSPQTAASLTFPDLLTEREQEVLQCIATGLSYIAIVEKLFISKNTVRTHLKNLYSKLNVNSRTQAIARAHELKLV
jgi:LuxR family maltose regulon positive regulatory protein